MDCPSATWSIGQIKLITGLPQPTDFLLHLSVVHNYECPDTVGLFLLNLQLKCPYYTQSDDLITAHGILDATSSKSILKIVNQVIYTSDHGINPNREMWIKI